MDLNGQRGMGHWRLAACLGCATLSPLAFQAAIYTLKARFMPWQLVPTGAAALYRAGTGCQGEGECSADSGECTYPADVSKCVAAGCQTNPVCNADGSCTFSAGSCPAGENLLPLPCCLP